MPPQLPVPARSCARNMQKEIDQIRRALRVEQALQHHIIVLGCPDPMQNDDGVPFGTKALSDSDVAIVCSSSGALGSTRSGFDDWEDEIRRRVLPKIAYGHHSQEACFQEETTSSPPTPESLPWPSLVDRKGADWFVQLPDVFATQRALDAENGAVGSGLDLEPMFIDTRDLAVNSLLVAKA